MAGWTSANRPGLTFRGRGYLQFHLSWDQRLKGRISSGLLLLVSSLGWRKMSSHREARRARLKRGVWDAPEVGGCIGFLLVESILCHNHQTAVFLSLQLANVQGRNPCEFADKLLPSVSPPPSTHGNYRWSLTPGLGPSLSVYHVSCPGMTARSSSLPFAL